ncbi:MAG: dihydropteroate synthase [Candidatus Nanopelagicales bacterium]
MIANSRLNPSGLPNELSKLDRCLVVGVLNVTPDSFSDGGKFLDKKTAIEQAKKLISDGADLIDIGGESTRPGAEQISIDEEIKRVIPVIEELKKEKIFISIDTMKHQVAEEAIKAGAIIVNDVSGGLADEKMFETVAELDVPYVLMHWRGHSKNMDDLAKYDNVTQEVINELKIQIDKAINKGVKKEKIVLDPGLGFAKNPEHNWQLLKDIKKLKDLGFPLYIGASRKRFLAPFSIKSDSSNLEVRDLATSVITTYSALNNAWAVRVHDAKSSSIAVKLVNQL